MMMMQQTITLETIQKYCGGTIFSRGMEYYRQNMFHSTYKYKACIGGQCRGSFGRSYHVEITLDSLSYNGINYSSCTCPTEHYPVCKHVATALITWHYSPDSFKQKNEFEMILMQKSKKWIVNVILDYAKTDSRIAKHIINAAHAKTRRKRNKC